MKSSSGNSLSEIETLRTRISSLETSNRDTLSIVESKTRANSELLQDLQKIQQKNTELNKKISELEQSVQAEKAAANSAKWREQNLQQELKLTKQNNEWFENELRTKREEAMKYRKEKGARISELERLNEEQRSTIESLTRGEQQLRSRLKEAQDKVEAGLSKIQQLQEAAARTEESFRQELEATNRLAELQVQQAETSKQRLKDVEARFEKVQDDFENQRRRIEKQLEEEKSQHQKAFERVQELEQENSRLQAAGPPQPQFGSRPQTPVANGSHLRAGSPFGTPGSLRGKGMNATQAFDELWKVKTELINVKKRNQQLVQELDETMTVLEAKAPEFSGLEEEIERLRAENISMTQLADESYQERDMAKKAARKAEAALHTAQSEANILRAQLRDLGTQIQLLVFNLQAQERGWDQLTHEELVRFEQLQNGEIAEGALDDLSDTHRFISERFVAFKDIQEMQAKNEELLRITRELAERMESEEALAAKQQAADNEKELISLRETCARLQDEIRSITVRMQSHIKERDMFRRMAESARARPGDADSAADSQREVLSTIEQNPMEEPEATTILRELQSNFDTYRQESSIDRKAMREQVEKLSAEKNSLQAEVARVRSQYDLAQERLSMLQSNYEALQNEKSELQRRNQGLSEAAAKQDLRSQQLATDLVETKALLDSIQSKNANLVAEKELSASIRDRLTQDNESLSQEKARLNAALSHQQSLMNEKEASDAETRRGLQEQIESLKADLNTTKRKLSEEIDESRKLQQRKEFEAQQHQQRVDELVASLNAVKEELIAAKTSKDHLQARVDELTIELRNAQEKAERLQPRPTPRPGTAAETRTPDAETEAQIEEFINEISDLKRDLDLANAHLESAQAQVEQYKDIANGAEESLTTINESQEQYREQMESALAAKDAQIKELEQRIEDVSTELGNSNTELTTLRDSQAEVARKYEDEKRIIEEEVSRLKDDAERLNERAKYHQQDLRAQADIAKKAQQDYETELVKHAEAAKALQALRAQHNQLKTDSASWKAEAESAKHTLEDNKQSFSEREQQLRREILELKERRRDVDQQNKLLQEQLDSFASQLASIKENRTALIEAADDTVTTIPGSDTERLVELNKYLHREKEILEVQYNLKVREAERLQQQLESKQSQLEETQLKLEQERVARADTSTAKSHEELMTKLNELNLIRESNTTLRNENKRLERQLEQKNAKIQELQAKIDPLTGRVSELESQKEFLEEELKQLGEDRDRWAKRVESIVTQQGRVDPAEMDQLKQQVSDLECERDELKQGGEGQITELQAKITELESKLETERVNWNATRSKIIEQAKNKNRENSTKIAELVAEKSQLQAQLDEANQRLAALQADIEAAGEDKVSLEQQLTEMRQQLESASQIPQTQEASADASSGSADQLTQLQQQLEGMQQELAVANEARAQADQDLASLRSQLEVATQERDAARTEQPQTQEAPESTSGPEAQAPQNDNNAESQAPMTVVSDAERVELEQKLGQAQARVTELEAEVAQLQGQVSETENHMKDIVDKRSQKMKEALNKKLAEDRAKNQAELAQEKEKLQGEYTLRLQQERAIWEAENKIPAVTGAAPSTVPSTPAKPTEQTPAQTPAQASGSSVSSMLVADFSQLSDSDTRQVLSQNGTLKAIITNNIKNKLAIETKKIKEETEQSLKTEYDSKIASAKEQATMMASKKSTLQLNMQENKVKMATAKLHVVETAAKETPQRPVGEVWEEAKKAKPPPPAAAAPQAASSPAANKTAPAAGTGTLHRFGDPLLVNGKANQSAGAVPQSTNGSAPKSTLPAASAGEGLPANPFAASTQSNPTAAPNNPFKQGQQHQLPPSQAQGQTQQQQAVPSGIPVPAAAQGQQQQTQPRTGIPMPHRGGAPRGRGGVYQRGRGGFQQTQQNRKESTGGLNPGAENFQPGNKRPSTSAETDGQKAKRQRGGGASGGAPNRGG